MKKKHLVIPVLGLAMLSTSCGNKETQTETPTVEVQQEESSITRMSTYEFRDSATIGSHLYVYSIVRQADENLPAVTDEMGDTFADNSIQLRISKDGNTYFDQRITKRNFDSKLDKEFLANSILDGVRFMKAEAGRGLTFSFSVSYPESDMTCPFSVTITDDGNMWIVKDEVMDLEGEDDDADGV